MSLPPRGHRAAKTAIASAIVLAAGGIALFANIGSTGDDVNALDQNAPEANEEGAQRTDQAVGESAEPTTRVRLDTAIPEYGRDESQPQILSPESILPAFAPPISPGGGVRAIPRSAIPEEAYYRLMKRLDAAARKQQHNGSEAVAPPLPPTVPATGPRIDRPLGADRVIRGAFADEVPASTQERARQRIERSRK